MTIRQFIQKARLGGAEIESDLYYENNPAVAVIFLMPEAWKAVGKVEGWPEIYNRPFSATEPRAFTWKNNMHRMIDALADGKTIEQYLETL